MDYRQRFTGFRPIYASHERAAHFQPSLATLLRSENAPHSIFKIFGEFFYCTFLDISNEYALYFFKQFDKLPFNSHKKENSLC